MKFTIEPINESDCRIVDLDISDMDGQKLTELKIPSIIEQDGKCWNVKEVRLLKGDLALLDIAEGIIKISGDFHYLEKAILPSTLEEIGEHTFYLTNVLDHINELPASLKIIGKCAFAKSFSFTKLEQDKELHILSPHISISEDAFDIQTTGYNRIKLVASEDTMRSIMGQPGALNGTAVEVINIPEGATEVNVDNCPRLKTISIPDSVEIIHKLSNIGAEIIASAEVWKKICAVKYCLAHYNPENPELNIPEGVTEIASGLLSHSQITRIYIPSTVESIGCDAFNECKSLEVITFAPNSKLKGVSGEAISGAALKEVTFPSGMESIGEGAFTGMDYLESVTFPASMTNYGNKPFVRCKKLKEVVFLADDPDTAVYPRKLGKMVNWYVPDHMVEFVEAYIEKVKSEYALPDGIGAKAVKPLSKRKVKK